MKNKFSKNIIFGLVLITNVAFCVHYIAGKQNKSLRAYAVGTFKKPAIPTPKKTATVTGVGQLLNQDQLTNCYNDLILRAPEVGKGTLHLHLTFNTEGEVNYLKLIDKNFGDGPFEDCVLEEIKSKRYPASASLEGKLISHKLNFHRKDEGSIDFSR